MQQLRSCKAYIPSFSAKIKALEIDALGISDYSERYLSHLQKHIDYYLHIYAHVLDNAAACFPGSLTDMTLVDYGCGNGLLGLFARHCELRKVWLCDTDSNFIEAAQRTAVALEIIPNDFIIGDTDALLYKLHGVNVDAVVGTDVIEHIYDLDDFFASITQLTGKGITVFTTASNPNNFLKRKALQRLQARDEHVGSQPADFALAGAEAHLPFRVIRENIIAAQFPAINSEQVKMLSERTRGLRKDDIIESCERFVKSGEIPDIVAEDSNTCHPLTGSWTERILPLGTYDALYRRFGMSLVIKNGFYNGYGRGIRPSINKLRNVLITLTGKTTAPFLTLIGCKTGS